MKDIDLKIPQVKFIFLSCVNNFRYKTISTITIIFINLI